MVGPISTDRLYFFYVNTSRGGMGFFKEIKEIREIKEIKELSLNSLNSLNSINSLNSLNSLPFLLAVFSRFMPQDFVIQKTFLNFA